MRDDSDRAAEQIAEDQAHGEARAARRVDLAQDIERHDQDDDIVDIAANDESDEKREQNKRVGQCDAARRRRLSIGRLDLAPARRTGVRRRKQRRGRSRTTTAAARPPKNRNHANCAAVDDEIVEMTGMMQKAMRISAMGKARRPALSP